MRRGAIVAAMLLSLLLVLPGCLTTRAAGIGSVAPDFTLQDIDGNTIRLRDLRGQTVFLNFWASWCGPCLAEMPDIQKVWDKYRDQGVHFIGIDLDETVAEVRDFTQRGGYDWTFTIDTTGAVARAYRADLIPNSFFIDGEGIIRAMALGAIDEKTIEAKLLKAMP